MSDFSVRAESYEQESAWILSRDFIEPLVPAPFGNRKILDVCTGTGVIAKYAVANGWNVTAVDNNLDIIRHISDNITVICVDANHLPFDDNMYDLVVCRQGLQYLDRCLAIREMLRVSNHEVRLLHGFIFQEDIQSWKELFQLLNKNNRDFFDEIEIYNAIASCSPSKIESDYFYSIEKISKTPNNNDLINRFLQENPKFVEHYFVRDHGKYITYKLRWIINSIIK